jgi:hypothetical protein
MPGDARKAKTEGVVRANDGVGSVVERRVRLKLLLAVGAAATAIALVFVAADPKATSYELSVYDAYPLPFWFLVLVATFFGQLVIFESGYADRWHRYWKWGLALVLGINAVLLLLPALRYELFARGDMLTYIGMIRRIGDLGAVPRTNYYPNVHLLALTVSYATGIAPSTVINVLPPVASLFYIVSLYPLLNVVFGGSRKVLFVLPFSSLLLFSGEHVFFHPSVFAFMTLPFAFYLLFRSYGGRATTRFRAALLVVVVAVTFYHPVVTVFFVGMLGLLWLSVVASKRLASADTMTRRSPLVVAVLAFVLFFAWYYSFESIIGSTLIIVYTLMGVSEGSSQLGNIASVFSRTTPAVSDIALVGIYTYGLVGAIIGLAFVFVGYYAVLVARGQRRFDPIEAFLAGTLCVFTFGAAVAFAVDVTIGFYRVVRYARFVGVVLVGAGFYTLFRRIDADVAARYLRPVVYLSLFAFAFLSVFYLYSSPLSNGSNLQITEAEVEGMEWTFEHRNRSLAIDQLGISQYRMSTYENLEETENIRFELPPPPDHFDYANASAEDLPSSAAADRRYLVTTELGRVSNPRLYPSYREFWRHSPQDFDRLERKPSVGHVYDDGTLDLYVISGVGRANQTAANGTAANGTAANDTAAIETLGALSGETDALPSETEQRTIADATRKRVRSTRYGS